MAYVYAEAARLVGKKPVGSRQCVDLVKRFAGAPQTARWREGDHVRGCKDIAVGTAIATFEDGKYPNRAHGNHAALYLGQNAVGIQVIDQWALMRQKTLIARTISFKAPGAPGIPSDDGNRYAVIE